MKFKFDSVDGAVRKKETIEEIPTPNFLKGSFYLTKIVHAVLPQQVPDVHQVGESKADDNPEDAIQVIDRQQIVPREEVVTDEHGAELQKEARKATQRSLENIGFERFVSLPAKYYATDEKGDTYYLEELAPWAVDYMDDSQLVPAFNEALLQGAIQSIEDDTQRKMAEVHFSRVLKLMEQEQADHMKRYIAEHTWSEEMLDKWVEEIKEDLDRVENTHAFEVLAALTFEGAKGYKQQRKDALLDLNPIGNRIIKLKEIINCSDEVFEPLRKRYNLRMQAIGWKDEAKENIDRSRKAIAPRQKEG